MSIAFALTQAALILSVTPLNPMIKDIGMYIIKGLISIAKKYTQQKALPTMKVGKAFDKKLIVD